MLDRSRTMLVEWVRNNLGDHLSEKHLHGLRDSLETVLKAHDRWEGQLTHLQGGFKA